MYTERGSWQVISLTNFLAVANLMYMYDECAYVTSQYITENSFTIYDISECHLLGPLSELTWTEIKWQKQSTEKIEFWWLTG